MQKNELRISFMQRRTSSVSSSVGIHSCVQAALVRVSTIGEDLTQHLDWAGKA